MAKKENRNKLIPPKRTFERNDVDEGFKNGRLKTDLSVDDERAGVYEEVSEELTEDPLKTAPNKYTTKDKAKKRGKK